MDNSLSLFPFTSLSHFLRLPRRLFIIYLLIGPAMGIGKSHMKYSFERLNRKYVALPQANLAPPLPLPLKQNKNKQTKAYFLNLCVKVNYIDVLKRLQPIPYHPQANFAPPLPLPLKQNKNKQTKAYFLNLCVKVNYIDVLKRLQPIPYHIAVL